MDPRRDIDAVTAANLRRLRQKRGLTQDAFAREAREALGLEWTRDHVAAIERGARRLSVGEVFALAHFFRVDLSEFLRADGWVWLTPGLRAQDLQRVCEDGGRLHDVEDPTDRAVARHMPRTDPTETAASMQAEQKAAAALGTDALMLALQANALWGRSLTDERERRVAALETAKAEDDEGVNARGRQALRGHVTRQLYAELRAALESARPARPKRK